jgi:hypothetical protein
MGGKIQVKIKLPKLINAIDDATAETMHELASESLMLIRDDIWRGFKYGPYYPEEQRGTSGNSWQVDHLQRGEENYKYGFTLINNATVQPRTGTKKNGDPYSTKSVGNFYAAYVQKSGDNEPLVNEVKQRINSDLVPDFEIELLINILNATANNVTSLDLEADKNTGWSELQL